MSFRYTAWTVITPYFRSFHLFLSLSLPPSLCRVLFRFVKQIHQRLEPVFLYARSHNFNWHQSEWNVCPPIAQKPCVCLRKWKIVGFYVFCFVSISSSAIINSLYVHMFCSVIVAFFYHFSNLHRN